MTLSEITKELHGATRQGILGGDVGLGDSRKLFFEIRSKCQIIVKSHAFKDHPKRGFSKLEIINLIQFGTGSFQENKAPSAIDGSFLFRVKDELGR